MDRKEIRAEIKQVNNDCLNKSSDDQLRQRKILELQDDLTAINKKRGLYNGGTKRPYTANRRKLNPYGTHKGSARKTDNRKRNKQRTF